MIFQFLSGRLSPFLTVVCTDPERNCGCIYFAPAIVIYAQKLFLIEYGW